MILSAVDSEDLDVENESCVWGNSPSWEPAKTIAHFWG